MKNKILSCVVSLLCVSLLWAEPATSVMAQYAALGWLKDNANAFGEMGDVQTPSLECDDEGNGLWWVVPFSGGGAIVTSAETRIEPILSVLKWNGDIPANHPLRAMLTLDVAARSAQQEALGDAAEDKWMQLIARARPSKARTISISTWRPSTVIKVADGFDLNGCYTHWNQSWLQFIYDTDSSWYKYDLDLVYNYHTPKNYVTGCTAAAGAALLQFFNVTKAIGSVKKTCYVDGVKTDLTTTGGAYDWSILPTAFGGTAGTSNGILTDAQIDLLSRATYDVGVCVQVQYGANWTSGYPTHLIRALRDNFGFADARYCQGISSQYYEQLIYSQLRCGIPVMLAVSGAGGGHQVLAVGYGEDSNNTRWTRVFMGWSGAYDAWYALPNVDDYSMVDSVGTMLGVTDDVLPLYGRVTDQSGNPISGATITATDLNKTTTSDQNGYWAMRVNPASCQIEGNPITCAHNNQQSSATFNVGNEAKNKSVKENYVTDYGIESLYSSDPATLATAIPAAINFTLTESGVTPEPEPNPDSQPNPEPEPGPNPEPGPLPADSLPSLGQKVYEFNPYKYFGVAGEYEIQNLKGGRVTLKKIGKSKLPSGVRLKYDKKTGKILLSGAPSKAGEYEYTFRIDEKVGRETIQGVETTFRFIVKDTKELMQLNPAVGKKIKTDVPIFAKDGLLVGLLNVSISTKNAVSAKIKGVSKKSLSFKGNWQDVNEGELCAILTSKAGEELELVLKEDGNLCAYLLNLTGKYGNELASSDWGVTAVATDYSKYEGERIVETEDGDLVTLKISKKGKVSYKGVENKSIKGSTQLLLNAYEDGAAQVCLLKTTGKTPYAYVIKVD